MPQHDEQSFSAPAETHRFSALLFDMDGTIIDSTEAIIKHWHKIGREIGIDPEVILATSHGRRSIDVLRILEPRLATWEYVCKAEGQIPLLYGSSAIEVPGSRALLSSLDASSVPWAIVTSGTKPLVQGWVEVLKLAQPRVLVSAEEVEIGKPDPECYSLGAERLGFTSTSSSPSSLSASAAEEAVNGESQKVDGERKGDNAVKQAKRDDILVLEDAPAGVRAGKAAGFKVVALATTHDVEKLVEAGADWIVRDMRSVRMRAWDGKTRQVEIEILDALVL